MMGRQVHVIVLAMVLGLVSCATITRAAPKINTLATLSAVVGEVLVQKSGASDWKKVSDGALLRTGDRVKTGAKSSCAIKWSRGNTVKLMSFSMMKMEKLEKNPASRSESSELNLWTGKMYARVKKMQTSNSTFEVRTPTAIAGVRGTTLSVEIGMDESSSITCFDGEVVVRGVAGGEVLLKDKQKTTVKKDEQPKEAEELSEKEVNEKEEIEKVSEATLDIMALATNETPLDVRGRTEPGNTVTVNGTPVTVDDKGIFGVAIDLVEGDNEIKIEATTKAGTTTAKTRIVKYQPKDPDAACKPETPGLRVTCPRQGYVTRDSSIAISGAMAEGASVMVGGIPVGTSAGSTSFSVDATLIEGENTIEVVALACEQEESVTCASVFKDTTAPRLIISQPAASFGVDGNGCTTSETGIDCLVIGLTEEDASLTINGVRMMVESDGSFEQSITLSYDQLTMEIAASDAMGNRTTEVLTRVLDRSKVTYLEVSASPTSFAANGRNTSAISVRAMNILREPVDAIVTIMATGGTLSTSALTLSGGSGDATFTAGVVPGAAVITVVSGSVTDSVSLTLTPDSPPTPNDR